MDLSFSSHNAVEEGMTAPDSSSSTEKLWAIQCHISSFQYNYTGTMFYTLKKSGGTSHICKVVRQIETYRLPIQCVEAIFLSAVLTDQIQGMVRFPLSFKSRYTTTFHRHIVLAVHYKKKWGAMGISRRDNLMYKPLVFDSLSELIEDYRQSYIAVYHRLLTVYLGLPMPHNMEFDQKVVWKALKLRLEPSLSPFQASELDEFLSQFIKR
ncbi:hypothetical protein EON65_18175 [archaeon]|nr:MAG: hypothetical protein EON65_18175 [archaeon]